jgi:transcriptional regulator with XRE-family HTH domain
MDTALARAPVMVAMACRPPKALMMSALVIPRSMQTNFAFGKRPVRHVAAISVRARPGCIHGYPAAMAKDPFKVDFGRRLRATAAEFGCTTAQSIADLCGAERAAVDTWLNGRAMPKWHQAARLCDAWRVTLDWLILGKADALPHSTYVRLAAALDGGGITPGAPPPPELATGSPAPAPAALPAAPKAAATALRRR